MTESTENAVALLDTLADQSDPRLLAVRSLLNSKSFSKSPRLSRFLAYVTHRAILNRLDEINEQQVGIYVFDKSPTYNPAEDNVVRGAARQLRQKLALYYQEEAPLDQVRVSLPRGSYVPHFDLQPASPEAPEELVLLPSSPPLLPATPRSRRLWLIAPAALALLALAWFLRPAPTLYDQFWAEFLAPSHKTFLVPCDMGIVMVQNATKKPFPLSRYGIIGYEPDVSGLPETDTFITNNFAFRKYTSIADVRLATRLMKLAPAQQADLEIRFGRDIRVEDLKTANAFLVGGPQGNPWIELFNKDAAFHVETDDHQYVQTVINHQPQPGEQPRYVVRHNRENVYTVYSIVAFQPNLGGAGNVITITGTSMTGLDAASQFLFEAKNLSPFLAEIRRDNRFAPFEVLLASRNVSNNAIEVEIVAKRIRNASVK